jgi:hypothetical protein
LEERVGQVERKSRTIALLPGFQIVQQPPDVGDKQIADLGLPVKRRVDLGKRVL